MTQARSDEPFFRVGPAEARDLIEKGIRVLDVREPQEYAEVRVPSATLVPLATFMKSPRAFLGEGGVLFICSEGIRSAVACEMAAAIGREEVYNLEGGTQRWEAEGYPVEAGQQETREVVESPSEPGGLELDFLQAGERLVRVHRFRYIRAVGCALGGLMLTVEEAMGEIRDPSRRCTARPDHPERVARPEFTVYEESVEAALRAMIEKLRGRLPADIFLPTE